MTQDTFEKAQALQFRITQLKLFKDYLESLINQQPMEVTFKGVAMGHSVSYPMQLISGKQIQDIHPFKEDGFVALTALERRTEELQKELDML